jgi:general secretion pathway protein A
MEPVTTILEDGRDRMGRLPTDGYALPSRAAAIGTLRGALETREGPILLTGDAGMGKTWLCRRLRETMPFPWRWAVVDLSPANTPADLYRMIGRSIGLATEDGLGASRIDLEEYLLETAADGDRWVLVADEAHGALAAVLEEVRILANGLGRPDRFAGLVLVGQTALARRLALRPLAAVGSRLSARVHLKPIDIEEARLLIDKLAPGSARDAASIEGLHRDARGNPKRLIALAQGVSRPLPQSRPIASATAPDDRITPPVSIAIAAEPRRGPAWDAPLSVPSKPPLRVEDGLIEVGWEPPRPPETTDRAVAQAASSPSAAFSEGQEPIDDHYTALQAWNEWARNQGRTPASGLLEPSTEPSDPQGAEEAEALVIDPQPTPTSDNPDLWIEGEHGFAPYSQLFSRLRTSR